LEDENMFIDDKLRKVLVECAEEIGISASMLLDWACTLSDDWAPLYEGEMLASVILEMLRDGDLKIVGISNQRPVLSLTKQGERESGIPSQPDSKEVNSLCSRRA